MNYLLTLFLLAFILMTFGQYCGINEEFTECGTACPKTCRNLYKPNRICIDLCVVGCQCIPGYVRNYRGICIHRRKCRRFSKYYSVFVEESPQSCPDPNEIYNECGTACPVTCANMHASVQGCTKQCVSGCECRANYVRDERGVCVHYTECSPNLCNKPNEVYDNCGHDCQKTCKNYMEPEQMCNRMCQSGCFCAEPYVRDEDSGKCVLTKECPNYSEQNNEENSKQNREQNKEQNKQSGWEEFFKNLLQKK